MHLTLDNSCICLRALRRVNADDWLRILAYTSEPERSADKSHKSHHICVARVVDHDNNSQTVVVTIRVRYFTSPHTTYFMSFNCLTLREVIKANGASSPT